MVERLSWCWLSSLTVLLYGLPRSICYTIPLTKMDSSTPVDEKYKILVQWMKTNDGRVDDRLGIATNLDGTGRGLVALDDIAAGTELIFCPWKLVLGTVGDTPRVVSKHHCNILSEYAEEVRAGKESFWYPYLSLDDSLATSIPTVWKDAALAELQGLLPDSSQSSLADWFSENCAGGTPFDHVDIAARQSLFATITRSAGMRFLPIFDLMNHHNGLLNTRSNASADGNSVFAMTDIPKGAEIFNSYRGGSATSSDVFRRYGFIEAWPQQWAWTDATTSEEQRILLLPDNSIMIYPPESIISQIGTVSLDLSELQVAAETHNSKLPIGDLAAFCGSGKRRIDTFESTVEEDAETLKYLLSIQKQTPDDQLLKDMISAVAFRKQFKATIQKALIAAENMMQPGLKTKIDQEL